MTAPRAAGRGVRVRVREREREQAGASGRAGAKAEETAQRRGEARAAPGAGEGGGAGRGLAGGTVYEGWRATQVAPGVSPARPEKTFLFRSRLFPHLPLPDLRRCFGKCRGGDSDAPSVMLP